MRTRLDEIVEEACREECGERQPGPIVAAILKKVAERAFRHGVEQKTAKLPHFGHCREQSYMYADGNCTCPRGWNVQPAPAGEKPCGCVGMCITAPCTLWCQRPEKRHHGPCLDRRKGERRKASPDYSGLHNGTLIYSLGGFSFHDDRRSGEDRRKP